jgi:hypothetical protein
VVGGSCWLGVGVGDWEGQIEMSKQLAVCNRAGPGGHDE